MSLLIECTDLSKSYGAKRALKDVNFTLESGAATALVGPNGAGKTTLFSILCHYQLPCRGQVSIMGHPPGSQALFGQLSALPQDAQLDPGFAINHQLEFLAKLQGFNKKQARIECQRVLELVQLIDIFKEKPAALSHGMRKRVAIAQALIGQPKLVMLDEPTAGLDPANAKNIRQIVSELSDQVSFIISSHNLNELEQLCSTVLMLEQGQLTQQSIGATTTNSQQHITLLLEPVVDEKVLSTLQNINGIIKVKQNQKFSFTLSYDPSKEPQFDLQLLQTIYNNGWHYRQLTKGLSLEEQLFS